LQLASGQRPIGLMDNSNLFEGTPAPLPLLPAEILGEIAYHTALVDIGLAKRCNLVSRNFRTQFQPFAFRIVSVADAFEHNVKNLLECLSDNPTLMTYIQRLEIKLGPRTDSPTIPELLRVLREVPSLSICWSGNEVQAGWQSLDDEYQTTIRSICHGPFLRSLTLTSVTGRFEFPPGLVFGKASSLVSLSIKGAGLNDLEYGIDYNEEGTVTRTSTYGGEPRLVHPRDDLASLEEVSCAYWVYPGSDWIYSAVEGPAVSGSLACLSVEFTLGWIIGVFPRCLSAPNPHLIIQIQDHARSGNPLARPFKLVGAHQLRSLTLIYHDRLQRRDISSYVGPISKLDAFFLSVCHSLSTLPRNNRLACLCLRYTSRQDHFIDVESLQQTEGWRSVCSTLETKGHSYPALKKVRIDIKIDGSEDEIPTISSQLQEMARQDAPLISFLFTCI